MEKDVVLPDTDPKSSIYQSKSLKQGLKRLLTKRSKTDLPRL